MLSSQTPPSAARKPDAIRQMLAQLWEKNRDLFRERLRLLCQAATRAASGELTPEDRQEAAGEAHKLAGSLGMFGYPHASVLAHELEVLLLAETPADPAHLLALLNQMQSELPL